MIQWDVRLKGQNGAERELLELHAEHGIISAIIEPLVNDVGPFVMVLSGASDKLAALELDGQVEWRWADPEEGIDSRLEYEGFIREKRMKWNKEEGLTCTVSGVAYNDLLRRTILDVTAGSVQSRASGPVETAIKTYVEEQLGPTAASRARQGFSVETDQGRGDDWNGQRTGTNMLDLCREIAGGRGDFEVVGNGDGLFLFRWYPVLMGTDRSASVIFSVELDNLESAEWSQWSLQEVNAVLAAGQGAGSRRMRQWYEDADRIALSPWGRQELYADMRDLGEIAQMEDRASAALEEGRPKATLIATPMQLPGLRYGREYVRGDRVATVLDGVAAVKQITGARFEIDATGTAISLAMDDIPAVPSES